MQAYSKEMQTTRAGEEVDGRCCALRIKYTGEIAVDPVVHFEMPYADGQRPIEQGTTLAHRL